MGNKTCYIINFYLGDRRKATFEYEQNKLYYLIKQINNLQTYSHSLNKIIFSFNMREEDYEYVSLIFDLVPKYIQGIKVEIYFRKNYGLSYGAWSDAFIKNEDQFDYFIFNEDDYFFVQDNWDTYLVNKFNLYEDCGYLCMVTKESHHLNSFRKHAGHSSGISSNAVLKQVKNKFGILPHSKNSDYSSNEVQGQINQSFCMLELGYNIYDVRDDYRIPFAWTDPNNKLDIIRFYWWNNNSLIIPDILLNKNQSNNWWQPEGEHSKIFTPSTIVEALNHYQNKINYGGY
jgi:hypothetical protein